MSSQARTVIVWLATSAVVLGWHVAAPGLDDELVSSEGVILGRGELTCPEPPEVRPRNPAGAPQVDSRRVLR